jgi:NAD(P)H-nitrite reductase large subunit
VQLDDELCLCFHVSKRKVQNYLRIERPRRVAELSKCQGAGTGCGWCRPYLERLFDAWQKQQSLDQVELPDADQYASDRSEYRRNQPPS